MFFDDLNDTMKIGRQTFNRLTFRRICRIYVSHVRRDQLENLLEKFPFRERERGRKRENAYTYTPSESGVAGGGEVRVAGRRGGEPGVAG